MRRLFPAPMSLFFALSLVAAPASVASTIHVPQDYPTIQAALDVAQDGDDVLVSPGVYPETIIIPPKRIWLHSEAGPESTTIDGAGSGPVVEFSAGCTLDTILEGFTVTNGVSGYGGGIFCRRGIGATIRNNRIVHNTATWDGGGVYPYAETTIDLEGNFIGWNTAAGQSGGLACAHPNSVIRNNIFVGNQASYGGAYYSCSHDVVLENNTFYGNDAAHGSVAAGDHRLSMVNCVVWGNAPAAFEFFGGGSFQAFYSTIENGAGQSWFGEGCLESDPMLADPQNDDFRLIPMSPALNAGDPDPIYDDLDGTRNDQGDTGGPGGQGRGTQWYPIASMPIGLLGKAVVTVAGKVYVLMGILPDGTRARSVYRYDPKTNSWSQLADYPGVAIRSVSAAVLDGYVYILGGYIADYVASDQVWRFDPAEEVWSQRPSIPAPRLHASATVASGKLYLIGGRSHPAWRYYNTVYVYDPSRDTGIESSPWSRLTDANPPTVLGDNEAVSYQGRIYTFGSYEPRVAERVMRYTPFLDRPSSITSPWEELRPSPFEQMWRAPRLVRFRAAVWFMGGALSPGGEAVDRVWIFEPPKHAASVMSDFVEGPPLPEPIGCVSPAVADGLLFAIGCTPNDGRCYVLEDAGGR